jgi:hypothetical protein
MGCLAFGGSISMMQFVKLTSAYALSLVGIARMAFSLAVSIALYRKPLLMAHAIGSALFVAGLLLKSQLQRAASVAPATVYRVDRV